MNRRVRNARDGDDAPHVMSQGSLGVTVSEA